MALCNIPTTKKHGGKCFHDYEIIRVIWQLPNTGILVLGDDDRFHVVHQDCVQGRIPEIQLDLT